MDLDADYAHPYCEKIQEHLDKGFRTKMTPEEGRHVWIFPHFGKITGADALQQRPNVMSPLMNVLLKFRQ